VWWCSLSQCRKHKYEDLGASRPGQKVSPISKITRAKWAEGMAQAAESLPSKLEAQSLNSGTGVCLNPNTIKKKKENKKKEGKKEKKNMRVFFFFSFVETGFSYATLEVEIFLPKCWVS
jgi:hypothetical protein